MFKMKKYTVYLHTPKGDRNMQLFANDAQHACQLARAKYKRSQVSMFWCNWPIEFR